MAEANTTNDIKEIKQSLGQEVVPAVTGKPSRVLKERPKKIPRKITAGGASLFEIAAAIQADPTISVGEAIVQGKREAKERQKEEEGGALRRGTKNFLQRALGRGLGNWLADILDTKAQKQQKQITEVHRKFEEGNKAKADFLKGLLGDRLGGIVSRATTLTSTKISAFEKYQELVGQRQEAPSAPKAKFIRQPVVAPTKVAPKPVITPQQEEAHKALQALGYSRQEATERLQNAPAGASVQQLVRHGLNPSSVQLTKPQAHAEVSQQLSEQDVAENDRKEADEKKEKKEDKEFKKEVKTELKKIQENTEKKGGMGWLLTALGLAIGALIYKLWDSYIKPAITWIKDLWTTKIQPIFERISSFLHLDKVAPAVANEAHSAERKIEHGEYGQAGLGQTLGKKYFEGAAKEAQLKGNYSLAKTYSDRAARMGASDVWDPATKTIRHDYNMPVSAAPARAGNVAPKAAPVTPRDVEKASQNVQDAKKENDKADAQSSFADMLTSIMGMPDPVGNATLRGVNDLKAALPALAANKDPGGAVIKVGNDEKSASGYMGSIFDNPAVWGGRP